MAEPNATCQQCGADFHVRPSVLARGAGKFCSWECARLGGRRNHGEANPNWKGGWTDEKRVGFKKTCARCGRDFETKHRPVKYCSKSCASHGCKKGPTIGHRAVNGKGYIQITLADGSRALEHRLVWEGANGPIPHGHVIHHINRDRADNRLENLEMMTWGEHSALHNHEEPKLSPRAPTCHPDRKHAARGLCHSCYQREARAKKRGLPSLLAER